MIDYYQYLVDNQFDVQIQYDELISHLFHDHFYRVSSTVNQTVIIMQLVTEHLSKDFLYKLY
jgi:hypothetical protein